jgi:Cu/Ag efflux protein CusF
VKKTTLKPAAIVLAMALSSVALAQDPRGGPNEPGYSNPRRADSGLPKLNEAGLSFRGEVRAVNKASGTITLRHDSIDILGVRATTADYPVKESALLEKVNVGERVRFGAVLQGRSMLITNIAPAD